MDPFDFVLDYLLMPEYAFARECAKQEVKAVRKDLTGHAERLTRQLTTENFELRLRVAALLRLLIERGVISAEDYAAEVEKLKTLVAPKAKAQPVPRGVRKAIAR